MSFYVFFTIKIITRITHSTCVSVASVCQHAKRMRRIVLSSVACLTWGGGVI